MSKAFKEGKSLFAINVKELYNMTKELKPTRREFIER